MAYKKPSTAIYQLLENAGGAANTTPDLEVVIVGKLNNVQTVDVNSGISLANTKSTELVEWAAEIDNPSSSFTLPFNKEASFPGQIVDKDTVEVFLSNVQVWTYGFEFDLKLNATAVDKGTFLLPKTGVGFGDAGLDPTAQLPGGSGPHVKPGDLVLAYNTEGEHVSVVSAVRKDPLTGNITISIADPMNYTDSSTPMLTSFEIYRTFDTFRITDRSSIEFEDVNALVNPGVALSHYASPFPTANYSSDYRFRCPAQTPGGDPTGVHLQYVAQRVDTVGTILEITDTNSLKGLLGVVSENNPLALGVSIAKANSTTSIRALAVASDDALGYSQALDLLESERLYFLVPLTQDVSILQAFASHAKQLSTANEALWRMVICNTKIPTSKTIVEIVEGIDNTGPGDLDIFDGAWMLTSSSHTFINSGVVPGDILEIINAGDSTIIGEHRIEAVVNNQVLQVGGDLASTNNIVFSVRRDLTKSQQADAVAATSASFGSARVVHIQPDFVGVKIDGTMKYLPGFYLACALGGMGAGFPVQQGFTNIGAAGIDDLRHSNYYFTRDHLNTMAAKGTCLFVQDTQGGLPYCRHELTTDMSVLEYREILKVKNWDYLSYFYKDILDPFIGSWNITDDTLSAMRQALSSASENLMTQKVAKIGAPLMGYNIDKLEQNPESKDTTDIRIKVAIVDPNNYMNVDLVI